MLELLSDFSALAGAPSLLLLMDEGASVMVTSAGGAGAF
jgi:hypothetical protein